jgi:hypothetical protein
MSLLTKIRNFSGKFLLLVFSMQLLTSCYTANELSKSLNSSLSKTTDNLRMEFGPPTYILDNGDVGTIWVYSETFVGNLPGYIGSYGYYYLYTAPSTYEREASNRFWVNKNGVVVQYQSRGYSLEEEDKLKSWALVIGGVTVFAILLWSLMGEE